MKIYIEVHVTKMTPVGPSKSMQQGSFNVDDREYKKDWEFVAAVEAYKFFERMKRESGYMDAVIDKVLLNNQLDITKAVRQIRPVVDASNLPF